MFDLENFIKDAIKTPRQKSLVFLTLIVIGAVLFITHPLWLSENKDIDELVERFFSPTTC